VIALAVEQALSGPRLIERRAVLCRREPCTMFGQPSVRLRWMSDVRVSWDGGRVALLGGRGTVGDEELDELRAKLDALHNCAGASLETKSLALVLHELVIA